MPPLILSILKAPVETNLACCVSDSATVEYAKYTISVLDNLAQIIMYIKDNSPIVALSVTVENEQLSLVVSDTINELTLTNLEKYILSKCAILVPDLKFIECYSITNMLLYGTFFEATLNQYFIFLMKQIMTCPKIIHVITVENIFNVQKQFENIQKYLNSMSDLDYSAIMHDVEGAKRISLYDDLLKNKSRKIETIETNHTCNNSLRLKIHKDIQQWWNKLSNCYKNLLLFGLIISFLLLVPGAIILIVLFVINKYLSYQDNHQESVHYNKNTEAVVAHFSSDQPATKIPVKNKSSSAGDLLTFHTATNSDTDSSD